MTEARQVPEVVRKCISGRFGIASSSITDTTIAADVAGWDSLAYAELLMMIEQNIGVDLPVHNLLHVDNVGQLIREIQDYLS